MHQPIGFNLKYIFQSLTRDGIAYARKQRKVETIREKLQ